MRLRSRLLGIVLLLILALLGGGALLALERQWPAALAGFAAKTVCGGVFIAGRPKDEVIENDLLSLSAVMRLVDLSIDDDNQRVSASVPLSGTRYAMWRPARGCVLLPPDEVPETAILTAANEPNSRVGALAGVDATLRSERLQPATSLWPEGAGTLPRDQWPKGVRAAALEKAIAHAFSRPSMSSVRPGTPTGNGQGTRAIVVVHRGRLLLERYSPGFDARTPQLGWSMAKTVLGVLAWSRFQSTATDLRTPVVELVNRVPRPQWVGEWQRDGRQRITIDHLMTMFDGLDDPPDQSWLRNELPRMLWVVGDVGRFAGEHTLAHTPGTTWRYASPVSNLLSRVLRDQFASHEDYIDFPFQSLFDPIGALSATFESDDDGNLIGSSYLWASPHDWARLGWLLANDGEWQGRQIFPPGWIDYAGARRQDENGHIEPYGAHVWLTVDNPGLGCASNRPLPPDGLIATGVWGQVMAIFPTRQTVILRLGWKAPDEPEPPCQLLTDILDALP
ncbi:MAG: serine hydrolase [Burkholderiaceae bacterium]